MPTFFDNVTVVILAAGLGKRMKSNKAKVLHKFDGKDMILHVVEASKKIAGENIVVVVGYQAKEVENVVSRKHRVAFAYQDKQLGTGHAVMKAMPCLKKQTENVVILCGDVPLVKAESLKALVEGREVLDELIGQGTEAQSPVMDPEVAR